MEIDFMILWKKKVSEKKALLKKVSEMLETVFPNTDSNYLLYVENSDKTHSLPYKISSNSDDVVYLKIECDYSEAKSAKILSMVREKICNGTHRANFSIICTYDDASLSFCCRLMKPFGIFERKLREVMYLTTVKAFGVDWVVKTFPSQLISKIKEKKNGISDEKLTELAFEYLDYSEISSYLFDEKRWYSNLDEILDEELSDEKLNNMTKEEIVQTIHKSRKSCLWDILFSNSNDLKLLAAEVDFFRNYRNDTMHHHTMDISSFKKVQIELKKANTQLSNAIFEMEKKIYTKKEVESVFSSLLTVAAKMLENLNNEFFSIAESIQKDALSELKNMILDFPKFEIPNLNTFTRSLAEISYTAMPQLELPDFSSLIDRINNISNSDTEISSSISPETDDNTDENTEKLDDSK